MLNGIGDSQGNLESSDNEEDGEDEIDDEEHPELGKLSENDDPSWVMGTNSKKVQQHKEGFRQKWIMFDYVMQPGSSNAAVCISDSGKTYWMAKLKVPVVVK